MKMSSAAFVVGIRNKFSNFGFFRRCQSTLSVNTTKKDQDANRPLHQNALPYEEMPEVKGLPVIGSLLDYTPLRGFKLPYVYELWEKRHQEYGDIYKERLGSQYMVYCRTREDTETMFRLEGRTPIRRSIDSIAYMNKKIGFPDSVANVNGEKWYQLRRAINGPLLKNKMVWKYTKKQQEVSRDMVKFISENLSEKGEVDNLDSYFVRWAFEMAGTFVLNKRLGLLWSTLDPEMEELFDGVNAFMGFVADGLRGFEMWKYYETRKTLETARKVARSYEILAKIVRDEQRNSENIDDTTLGQVLKEKDLTEQEKMSLLCDILAASVETTSASAILILYCLTLEPEWQERLRNEILSDYNSDALTGREVDGLKNMAAFIKEVTRLFPFVHAHNRTYTEDIVLSGYRIPAGTIVVNTSNSTQNRNPDYFKEPDKFIPERWMKGEDNIGRFSLTGPFGMAARACPGRRFAMQEMRLLLIEVLKKFRIEYHHKPMVSEFRATGYPSEKPRFKFIHLN